MYFFIDKAVKAIEVTWRTLWYLLCFRKSELWSCFFGPHQKQKGPSVDKAMPTKKVFQNPETFQSKMIEKLSKLSFWPISEQKKEGREPSAGLAKSPFSATLQGQSLPGTKVLGTPFVLCLATLRKRGTLKGLLLLLEVVVEVVYRRSKATTFLQLQPSHGTRKNRLENPLTPRLLVTREMYYVL